jgi:hypothetical protein
LKAVVKDQYKLYVPGAGENGIKDGFLFVFNNKPAPKADSIYLP